MNIYQLVSIIWVRILGNLSFESLSCLLYQFRSFVAFIHPSFIKRFPEFFGINWSLSSQIAVMGLLSSQYNPSFPPLSNRISLSAAQYMSA